MAMTLEHFVAQLEDSGVISAADIAAFQNSLSPPAESAEDLGKLLVKHKKVTKLQAQLVYQGKGDQLLLGNYLILDKIGAGGMGDVYLAEHRRMERRVALKTLPAAMTRDTQSILRFQREVKAAAKLTHPNIVTAYDADEANGVHYFVMEYVEGIDLSAVVKKQGVLNVDVAVDYILQAAKGLEFAHNKGVIHRDIKPANLLLDNDGCVKILDMGLARIEDEAHEIPATQLTQDGSVMGTVDYMAPEQAKDTHTADARSDIYSLGCSLYYLLTGESVYRGSTMVNRIMAHQNDPIPSLTGKHILISQDVDAVFQKMVAKKPEDRFQSMSEVIVAIENCIQMKSSPTVSTKPSDPELQKFLQSQKVASNPTVVMSADAMTAEKSLTDTQNESLTSGFLNHTLGGTSYQPLAKRKKSIGKRGWVLMGAVLAPLIFMAGIVFKIDTPAGTIILEVDQPELAGAVVSVDEQKKITIKTGEGQEPIEVVADEKTHTLQVTKGGFETFTKQFTVKAGGKETIKVRLEPLVVAKKKVPSKGTPAKSHYALRFQNDSDHVTLPLKHETPGDLTVEAWVTIDEDSILAQNYITNTLNRRGLLLGISGLRGDEMRWVSTIANNDRYPTLETNSKVELGKRTNIAVTYKGNVAQIYVNGHKKGEMNFKGLEIHTDRSFSIGWKDIRNFKGSIDEVRFSNTARYTKDFTPKDRFESDEHTMALYHFDEGSGDVLKDSSGNGHDGKIEGARWVKVDDELQVTEPATTSEKPMTDREVAEWVIGMGGKAHISGKMVTKIEELPTGPLIITAVHLDNTSVKDDDLKRLAGLKMLLNVNLADTLITDTGIQYLKDIELEYLVLTKTKITDQGVDYLKDMKSLSVLMINSRSDESITNSSLKSLKNLKQLTTLNVISPQIDDIGIEHLAGLTNLETLYLYHTQITDNGLKYLQGMSNLHHIELANTGITDAGLEQLHGLKMLENLNLKKTKVTPQGIGDLQKALPNCKIKSDFGTKPITTGEKPMTDREVAEWVIGKGGGIGIDGNNFFYSKVEELPTEPVKFAVIKLKNAGLEDDDLATLANVRTLRALYLDFNPLHDAGFQDLKGLNQLETLSISNSEITERGLSHLKEIPKLRDLNVADSSITNSGMKAIGDLKQLDTLKIAFNSQIDDTGLGYIAGLTKLEKLYAHIIPRITDEGLKHLKGMKRLSVLTLATTGITDAGLEQLAAFENLSELDIINCKITDSGLLHLKDLKNLKKLGLGLTPVTDLGLQHLHGLKNLESLDLKKTKVTPQGIAELQKALPNCKIKSDFETKQHSSVNHALEFNGESSFVEIKTLTGAKYLEQKTDQFTIECWITPDLPDSSNPIGYCIASFPFSVSLNGNNVNTAIHAGDARNVIAYGSGSYTQLTEGRRYHIALLFSDGIQEIYINGKKQEHLLYKTQNGSTSKTNEKISLSTDANRLKQPTGIGAGNDLSATLNYKRFFKGIIDEVRISNIARYTKDFTPARRFEPDEHTLALYHFDEGSGDVLKDSSGNGHDGKIVGARWVKMDDKLQVVEEQVHGNHALEFDGKTSYVDLPVSYGGKLPITYELYIRPYSFPTSESRPLGTLYFGLQFQNRNKIQYWQLHATTSQIGDKIAKGYLSYCDKKITLLQRVHIAGVRNSNKLRLYVDGKECSTPLTFGDPSVSLAESDVLTAPFSIGASSSKYYVKEKLIKEKINGFFHGTIDEVRISNTARYSKDFTPASRFESDEHTMALYHFDEGSGDVLKDSSGNGHDGKIVGARWVKVDDKLQVIKPATTGDSPMTDREVAEWVIGMGGLVNIGVREFTNTKQLPPLPFVINNIKLAGTSVKDDDLKRLAGLNSLTSVDLQKTLVSDTGLQYLKDIPLYFLVLGNTKITDEGLEYLTNMPGLTHLYVNNPAISNSGVERLKGMKQLVVLNLGTTQIDDLSLGYLANLTNLKTLLIYLTRITDSGLKHLQGMKQLETLGLGSTGITDAGLAQLAKHENLKSLDITNCKITDSGVKHLKDLKNLKSLGLQLTPVTDLSLQHLHSMKQLESLELQETKVTPQGIAELQKALPNCKILSDFETKPTATKAP